MKKIIISGIAILLCQASAFAGLPRSAIGTLDIKLYGMYTTSDATCQTGLIATSDSR